MKNTPPLSSNSIGNQGNLLQVKRWLLFEVSSPWFVCLFCVQCESWELYMFCRQSFFFLQYPLLKSHFSSSFCQCTVVSLESMVIISLFSFPYKLQRNEMTIVVHRFSLLFTSPLFISIHSSLSLPCNVLDALWFTSSSLMDASFVLSKWETPGWILSFLFFFLIGTCGKMCRCLSCSFCISWF